MTSANVTVLPAYAGMIPAFHGDRLVRGRAPRVCGDDPAKAVAIKAIGTCSPRMRG